MSLSFITALLTPGEVEPGGAFLLQVGVEERTAALFGLLDSGRNPLWELAGSRLCGGGDAPAGPVLRERSGLALTAGGRRLRGREASNG